MNYRRLSTFLLSVAVITTAVLAFPAGSKAEAKKETSVGFYLDTVITLTAYVEDVAVLNDALAESGRYE